MIISPFEVENELNPVIFAHLRSPTPRTSNDSSPSSRQRKSITSLPNAHSPSFPGLPTIGNPSTFPNNDLPNQLGNSPPPRLSLTDSPTLLLPEAPPELSQRSPILPYSDNTSSNPRSPPDSSVSPANNGTLSNIPSADSLRSSATAASRSIALLSCRYCQATFEKEYTLSSKHVNRKHSRRFKCTVAGCQSEPFGLRADFERHKHAIHQAREVDELIHCTVPSCAKTFGRRDNMLKHRRKVHNEGNA
ncbi:hypothetical protein BDV96DRAFT_576927 [Lophiotrema nucula]|uniref:C2H2-type domain-containing protein n=1 Tax=Lophiotrema nucula TaxID=690887 RepID=A0A6A5Z7Z6_9PLEO|nr:hypothetical protein BDV96DRAFT_576927 [Lophiotrema nucula]